MVAGSLPVYFFSDWLQPFCSRSEFSTAPLFVVTTQATFQALAATYGFLTPELWRETQFAKSPLQEFTDFLQRVRGILMVPLLLVMRDFQIVYVADIRAFCFVQPVIGAPKDFLPPAY